MSKTIERDGWMAEARKGKARPLERDQWIVLMTAPNGRQFGWPVDGGGCIAQVRQEPTEADIQTALAETIAIFSRRGASPSLG